MAKIIIEFEDEKVELPKLNERENTCKHGKCESCVSVDKDAISAYLLNNDSASIKVDNIDLTGFESAKSKVDSNGNLKIKNYDLKDLKQKLINDLYEKGFYCDGDIELIRLLFENNYI